MSLSQRVELYKCWDVVTDWADERCQHEASVARSLARPVICDGPILNSVDKRWVKGAPEEMGHKRYPHKVGGVDLRPTAQRGSSIVGMLVRMLFLYLAFQALSGLQTVLKMSGIQ